MLFSFFFISLFLHHVYSLLPSSNRYLPTSDKRRISFRRFFIACIDVLIERRSVFVDGTEFDCSVVGNGESDGGKRVFRLDIDDDEDGTDFDRLCVEIYDDKECFRRKWYGANKLSAIGGWQTGGGDDRGEIYNGEDLEVLRRSNGISE